ncbi:MAG: arsenosugar biosynthesis radical SAM protein ArsS [Deltaproteobacteria bacterium]|nr:arsenosugar biosynthesis radical SAM protein ArsS [Deltaproteobacteria bacterium]
MGRSGAEPAWASDPETIFGFDEVVETVEPGGLRRGRVTTLQVNVGKLCNMACHHCHVDAGPQRKEIMQPAVAERVVELLASNPAVETLDLTGGAPELNPSFRWMIGEARRLGRHVIDRCNLTVIGEPGQEDLTDFLAANRVHVVASLPCYGEENVDEQRGGGTFAKSIAALHALNDRGYGGGSGLELDLVYNPLGAFLPPAQSTLQRKYKDELGRRFGVRFDRLLTMTNMPVKRFAVLLEKAGRLDAYMSLLVNHFNPATVAGLMCRATLSIGWDGRVYDCDFNQMLDLPSGHASVRTVRDLTDLDLLTGARVTTGSHCFGCTAGAGSSCSGVLQ